MAAKKRRETKREKALRLGRERLGVLGVGVGQAEARGFRRDARGVWRRDGKPVSVETVAKAVKRRAKPPSGKRPGRAKPVAVKPVKVKPKAKPAAKPKAKPKARPVVRTKPAGRPKARKPAKPKGPVRDRKGRFISKSQKLINERLRRAKRKIEKELEPETKKEERDRRRLYRITPEVALKQEIYVRAVGKAMAFTNPDLMIEYDAAQSSISTLSYQLTVRGFTSPLEDYESSRDEIVSALVAATENIKRRKGMLVQLLLVPEESVLMHYGREEPMLSTSWMLTTESEREQIVAKGRQLFEVAVRNKWDVVAFKLNFLYDREAAVKKER